MFFQGCNSCNFEVPFANIYILWPSHLLISKVLYWTDVCVVLVCMPNGVSVSLYYCVIWIFIECCTFEELWLLHLYEVFMYNLEIQTNALL